MASHPAQTLAEQFAAARDWWREAGVDCVFADEPESWLAEPNADAPESEDVQPTPRQSPPKSETPLERPPAGGDASAWPEDLGGFAKWWQSDPTFDFGGSRRAVAPRGPANASLMILVEMPEAEDRETLLSGREGRLLSAMLAAMGLEEKQCYIASVLPRHTPEPDWAKIESAGMGKVLRHHIGLAAPGNLLILGQRILPLIGHDPAQSPANLAQINHQSGSVRALASFGLGTLLAHPRRKAMFWQRWLDWTGNASQ